MGSDFKKDEGKAEGPYDQLMKRVGSVKRRLESKLAITKMTDKITKIQTKYAQGATMNEFDEVLKGLRSLTKQAFVPAEQLAQPLVPVDPATGMPMGPSMMMAPAGAPPMDPSMAGIPPEMLAAAMAGGGAPMDPSMAGGMPPPGMPAGPGMAGMPMDPSMMAAPAPAPAPAPAEPAESTPATIADISILEERLKGLESVIESLVDTMDKLGANLPSGAKQAESGGDSAPGEPEGGAPAAMQVPGPYGTQTSQMLASVMPMIDNGRPDVLIRTLNKLRDVKAGV